MRRGLRHRLEQYASDRQPPGFRSRYAKARFLHHVTRAVAKMRAFQARRFRGSTDPSRPDFHPYPAIRQFWECGERDEALWLAFLTICCDAVPGARPWESLRCLYGRFGAGCRWGWREVSAAPSALREGMLQHRAEVVRLRFGDHRKYGTHDPAKRGKSTADIVESYLAWVRQAEGSSQAQIFDAALRS